MTIVRSIPCTVSCALSRLAVFCLAAQLLPAQARGPSLVDVGGHRLNVQLAGTSKPGAPIVVFESGLGTPVAGWNGINLTIADSVRTVAYDRAGVGASEAATEPPTAKHIVAELHTLLGKVGAPPPYVLVGHSLGGPIINLFAATFPKEVAGLVYIDPTDFTQTDADMNAVWQTLGVKSGRDLLRQAMARMVTDAPSGIVAEWREYDRVERGGFAEFRAAGEAPEVPMVVLLAAKREVMPPGFAFPGFDRYQQAILEQRIDHFGRITARAAKGTLVLTTKSSHFIHATEPELVVWGIRRILSTASPHPDLQRFVGEYPLTPAFAITITREDAKLVLQATGQPAFTMAAQSSTSFSIGTVGAVIEFEIDAAGNVTGLVLVQSGRRQRAPKAK